METAKKKARRKGSKPNALKKKKSEAGRDANGHFKPGHGVKSPGRPPKRVEEMYLNTVMTSCPIEKWAEICNRAVKDAIAGDPKAREWVAKYVAPVEAVLRLIHEQPNLAEEAKRMSNADLARMLDPTRSGAGN